MNKTFGFLLVFFGLMVGPCGGEVFRNPYRLILPSTPGVLLHGDIDGDGIDDLVYSDDTAMPIKLHTLLGKGGGAYVPGPVLTLPTGVSDGCRLGDFNGDHRLDLACNWSSTTNASMVFFAGNGDATFGAPKYVALPSSPFLYFYLGLVSTGDLNGDGVPDLLGYDSLNNWSWPILSDGSGGFKIGTKTTVSPNSTFIDVNGDGKLDALEGSLTVALGNGDGTFGPPIFNTGPYVNYASCAYGDIDGDGHVDAVCSFTENVSGDIVGAWDLVIFHGNPDGTFSGTPEFKQVFGDKSNEYEDYGSLGTPVAVADINGDGIPDIVSSSVDGTTIFYGQGRLAFAPPVHFATGRITGFAWFLADVNGDGLPDFVSAGDSGIYFSYSQSNGNVKAPPAYEVTGVISYAATADFDGDGIPDVVATGDNYLAFSHGKGDGSFQPYTKIPTGSVHFNGYNTAMSERLMHGDFNGDGKQDLIVYGSVDSASVTAQYYYLQGNGDGTFQPIRPLVADQQFGGMYDVTRIHDMNGDGRDDILRAPDNFSGVLSVQLSNGDGSFTTQKTTVPQESEGNGFYWPETVPAVADFDKDGKQDLVIAARDNAYILHGRGDGTFDAITAISLPHFTDTGAVARSVATGDFDGDGNADFAVVWGGYTTGGYPPTDVQTQTMVFYGKGNGTFSTAVVAESSSEGFAFIDAADLNKDGMDELILRGAGSLNGGTNIAVLHGQANRTFLPETNYMAGNGLSSLDITDLNHDGFPDLVFANGDFNGVANSVTVLMNLGNTNGVLTASPEPSSYNQSITLTASLTPPAGGPATLNGSMSFSIDGVLVGSASLTNNIASLTVSQLLSIGAHQLAATWPGDINYGAVTLTASHAVTGIPVTVALMALPNPAALGQLVTLTQSIANSTNNPGDPPPTGTFTLTDNGATIGSGNSLNGTLVRGFAPAGDHTLTLTYSGDAYHSGTSASVVLTITPVASTISLQSSVNPSAYGQAVTFTASVSDMVDVQYHQILTSGTVTFSGLPGGPVTVPVPSSITGNINPVTYTTSVLPSGSTIITASFSGNTSLEPSTSAPLTQVVNPIASIVTLTVSPSPAYQSQTVTLTGSVSSASGTPMGTIQFLDGGLPLATIPIVSGTGNSAQVSFSTAVLALGVHTLTAVYSGDSNHLTAASIAVKETILPSSFTLTLDPTTLSLQTGHHATLTLTATSIGVFADTIRFTAASLPAYTSVTFNPTAVQLTVGGTATSSIYLDTDFVVGYLSQRQSSFATTRTALAFAVVPLTLLVVFRRGRRIPTLLAVAAVSVLLVSSTGCSGRYPPSTPPGSYSISIVGTPASNANAVTVVLPLTVTP